MAVYDYTMKDAQGNDINLADYKGKVLLIVNTATGCGFTPQYEGLEDLYEKYQEKGFEILDFPCNQFAGQAPGTDEEIVSETGTLNRCRNSRVLPTSLQHNIRTNEEIRC